MRHPYTAYYVDGGEGWVIAYAAEFPAIVTEGRSIEEARRRLREAVLLLINANRQITSENLRERHVLLREEQVTTG